MAGSPDYGEMISGIMSDPAAMSNVLKIAQSLMGTGGGASQAQASTPASAPAPAEIKETESDKEFVSARPKNEDSFSSIFSNLPASLTDKETAANRERLLVALKPYMSSDRRNMIDTILKMLRLAKIADIGKLLDGIK